MSVVNGMLANQTTFNNAFLSRTSPTTSTVSKLELKNPDSTFVDDMQAFAGEMASTLGLTEGDDNGADYSSENYIDDGDSHKVALGKLDAQLKTTTDDVADNTTAITDHENRLDLIEAANTEDVTLANVGSTPNAKGASISGQEITLQPASASFPGVISTSAQELAGDKRIMNRLGLAQTLDAATTGSDAVPTLVKSSHVFTDSGLASIEAFDSPYDNHFGLITNNTGTTVILKNLAGGDPEKQILTPSGADYSWPDKQTLVVYYDVDEEKWRLIGTSSAGGGGGSSSVYEFVLNGNPAIVTSLDSFRRMPFNANITNVIAWAEIAGTGGVHIFDIETKSGMGAWTSILSTLPEIDYTAGDDVTVGVGDSGTGLIAPILAVNPTPVAAGDLIRASTTSVQTGPANTLGVLIVYEPQ